jgi:hypothetical protein
LKDASGATRSVRLLLGNPLKRLPEMILFKSYDGVGKYTLSDAILLSERTSI